MPLLMIFQDEAGEFVGKIVSGNPLKEFNGYKVSLERSLGYRWT